ncbi:MAG: hypothetical protein V1874_14625 [Spirochaetota bacterium]
MNAGELLKAVIDRYELSEPVPQDVRLAMDRSRKENLVKILKKDARRFIFISTVVSFFLWIKKFGISLSIAKSAVTVTTACIISAGALTTAGVYTTKKIIEHFSAGMPNTEEKIEEMKKTKTGSLERRIVPGILTYAVAVSQIEMDEISNDRLYEYTNKIIRDLRNIKGAQAAININNLDKKHFSDKILSISIIKLKESQTTGSKSEFRISAKIVNSNNSQVLMYASETADNESMIQDSLRKLAKKISDKL